jgi:tetratricopeptide (TPR) repeat protein
MLCGVADCFYHLRKFEQAQKYYETASELPKVPSTVFRNLGLTCKSLNQHGKAIKAFRKYLQLNPQDAEITIDLANLCMQVGDFKAALPLFEKSLRHRPRDIQTIFNLAECYLNLGQEGIALIGYSRALELNPEFEPAKRRLAQLEEVSAVIK